jgi:zinc D-Ala-D-Ala dipeptidase
MPLFFRYNKTRRSAVLSAFLLLFFCCTRELDDTDMVNIRRYPSGIIFDIRYATENNFTGQKLYQGYLCFLRAGTAKKLLEAQRELRAKSLGLKVYDAYRPLSVQKRIWELFPDRKYITPPSEGSTHNRGAAVDVTLVTSAGRELDMGSSYDDFSERSSRGSLSLSTQAITNRVILKNVMRRHGFVAINDEWWHFDDAEWKKYEVLDKDFSELR